MKQQKYPFPLQNSVWGEIARLKFPILVVVVVCVFFFFFRWWLKYLMILMVHARNDFPYRQRSPLKRSLNSTAQRQHFEGFIGSTHI